MRLKRALSIVPAAITRAVLQPCRNPIPGISPKNQFLVSLGEGRDKSFTRPLLFAADRLNPVADIDGGGFSRSLGPHGRRPFSAPQTCHAFPFGRNQEIEGNQPIRCASSASSSNDGEDLSKSESQTPAPVKLTKVSFPGLPPDPQEAPLPDLSAEAASGGSSGDAVLPAVWGRVHSIESFSAVDGPAIRSVIFLQGCLRRCIFCANPDTWKYTANCQRLSSKDIAGRLAKNLSYYKGGGGVTLSGGEPFMQAQFCSAIFKEAHSLGITTAIDTAGYGHPEDWAAVLPHTDTVLLCTKAMDPILYHSMVGVKQELMLSFAQAVASYKVPLVIRFVLVPGMTDSQKEIDLLVQFALQQPTLVGVEILPYHRLGVNKWEELGLEYPLKGLEPSPKEVVDHWRNYISSKGIKVML